MRFHNFWLFEKIQDYKTKENLSLRQFSQLIGLSPSLLSRIFNGEREVTKKQLRKIFSALDFSDSEQEAIFHKYDVIDNKNKQLKERLNEHFSKVDDLKTIILKNEDFIEISSFIPKTLFHFFRTQPASLIDRTEQIQWLIKYYHYRDEDISNAIKKLLDLNLIIESDGKLQANCDIFKPMNQIEDTKSIVKTFNNFCEQSLKNYLPVYDSEGNVGTSLNDKARGFDVISWDYLFLEDHEVIDFKQELNNFHNTVLSLARDCTEGDLDYTFMGTQFFRL